MQKHETRFAMKLTNFHKNVISRKAISYLCGVFLVLRNVLTTLFIATWQFQFLLIALRNHKICLGLPEKIRVS
jgi:hypothetical protein